jgi:hypothetical protein
VTALATAFPAHVAVGDPIRVTISLDAPPRSTVFLRNPPSTADLTRVAATPWTFRREGATGRLERVETWEAFTPGAAPSFRYSWSVRPAAGAAVSGETATAPVTVASVLPPGKPPQPSGLRPPVTRPSVAWQLAAALLLAAAVAAAFAILARRRRGLSRVRDADEIFDGELDLLESSLAKEGPEEAFYDWLAQITRWYLEQKLGMPAPRLTSSEIAARLREPATLPRLPLARAAAAADGVAAVLAVCDGFRFARRGHRIEQAREAIASARTAAAAIRENEAAEPERKSA